MKRTYLAVAFVAASLAVVLFSGIALGRNGRVRIEKKIDEGRMSLLSPQISWEEETKYVMQWDDASKKLLFDGQAISHETKAPIYDRFSGGTIRGFRFRGASSIDLAPAPDHPDQYSFDVGTIGNFGGLSKSSKHDGQLHYHVEWDDAKECCVFEELEDPRTQEFHKSFVDGGKVFSRPYYNSFNSPLDLMDTYRSYRR